MPCYRPIKAWRDQRSINGQKYPLHFHKHKMCGEEIEIGCGNCIGCRLEKSRQWAIRCVHEAQLHEENTYLTLTYSPEHLPESNSLVKRDFQTFMKRYRKAIAPTKIRYFMCGEYGERCRDCKRNRMDCYKARECEEFTSELSRPHYHAVIFGHDFADKYHFKTENGFKYYRSPSLEKIWGMGHCTIGDVTFESAAYVARYCLKKINGEKANDHYMVTDTATGTFQLLQPEYTTMSRGGRTGPGQTNNGGIGTNWYRKYKRDLDKDFITVRGKLMRPPKYYDTLQERDTIEIDNYDRRIEERREHQRTTENPDGTPERLAVREKLKKQQTTKLKRGYENGS